jgi:1,2-diacylglycerol 3-beta-galactosyltransferase
MTLTSSAARPDTTAGDGACDGSDAAPLPVLLVAPATGGGHQAAARAVAEALRDGWPERFAPVLCDPLTGMAARPLARRTCRAYGPVIRRAPWLWGALYHLTDSRIAAHVLRRLLRRVAAGPIAAAVVAHRPAVIVSLHPMTGAAAVAARGRVAAGTPVVSVVTDLTAPHRLWFDDAMDRIVLPFPAGADGPTEGTAGVAELVHGRGLPVGTAFGAGELDTAGRDALRRALGLDPDRFWVTVAGGGEGAGGLVRRVRAILRGVDEVGVVALCGRNRRAARRLAETAVRTDGRLRVLGFTDAMADWLRCTDVLVTKAGPGAIAEAACCAVPLLLTGHLPGQERGNTGLVTAAGAGVSARSVRRMLRELTDLRRDPERLAALRAGAAGLAAPSAAADTAALLAELAGVENAVARAGRPRASGPAPRAGTVLANSTRWEVSAMPRDVGHAPLSESGAGHVAR